MTDRYPADAAGEQIATERRELEAERDYLLGSLRDLESERADGELATDDYTALHDSYTARAANVLRRLDELATAAAPAAAHDQRPETPDGAPGPESDPAAATTYEAPVAATATATAGVEGLRRRLARRRTWVVVAGLVILGVGIGLVASGATKARQAGQSVSGSVHLAPAQELQAARTAMASGDDVDALKLFQAVLRVEPDQPEALAYAGWLLREAGDAQEDISMVTQGLVAEENAVADDPRYPDARYFLGVMLLDEAHDPSDAVTQLEAYLALKPSARDAAAVKPILDRAQAEAAAGS